MLRLLQLLSSCLEWKSSNKTQLMMKKEKRDDKSKKRVTSSWDFDHKGHLWKVVRVFCWTRKWMSGVGGGDRRVSRGLPYKDRHRVKRGEPLFSAFLLGSTGKCVSVHVAHNSIFFQLSRRSNRQIVTARVELWRQVAGDDGDPLRFPLICLFSECARPLNQRWRWQSAAGDETIFIYSVDATCRCRLSIENVFSRRHQSDSNPPLKENIGIFFIRHWPRDSMHTALYSNEMDIACEALVLITTHFFVAGSEMHCMQSWLPVHVSHLQQASVRLCWCAATTRGSLINCLTPGLFLAFSARQIETFRLS